MRGRIAGLALTVVLLSSCNPFFETRIGASSFSQSWPFDYNTTSSYVYDSSKIDFTGGVCRLTPTDHADDANDSAGFAGGALSGLSWNASSGYLSLDKTVANGVAMSDAELSANWTPKWSNIVSYFKFNNGSLAAIPHNTTLTSTVGPNGLAANANTGMAYVSGPQNQSINFDGVDDVVTLVAPNIPFTAGSISIASWFQTTASASRVGLYTQGVTGGYLHVYLINGVLSFQSGDSSGTCAYLGGAATGNYADGAWHHVVVVRDPVNSLRLIYIDGKSVYSAADTRTCNLSTTSMIIGRDGTPKYFAGRIDEVAVWNVSLTANEIARIYERQQARFSGTFTSRVMDALATGRSWTTFSWVSSLPFFKELPDFASGALQNEASSDYSALVGASGQVGDNNLMSGLVGLWHLNESSGAVTASDKSGSGNTATVFGTLTSGITGILNKAMSFDGASAYLTATNAVDLPADHTMVAWVNPTATGNYLTVFDSGDNNHQYNMYVHGGKLGSWHTSNCSNVAWDVPTGQWSQIAFTYFDTTGLMTAYINGQPAGTCTQVHASVTTTKVWIGAAYNASGYFPGAMDELGLWSRALDAKEILQLYRRAANRVKYQVRVCTAADCSDDSLNANWKGPDGTSLTYFSELNNNTVPLGGGSVKKGLPALSLGGFTNPIGSLRYFQYRTILESTDTATSPDIKSVTVDPIYYDATSPTVVGRSGAAFSSLTSFTEKIGTACASGVSYNLGTSTGTWYWWDSSKAAGCVSAGSGAWCLAGSTAATSNGASTVLTNIASFASQAGTGTAYFRAFLKSNGATACELDRVDIEGLR